MTDYISREAAIKRFNFAVLDCLGMEPTIRAGDIIKALESIPAADVRPVVRAEWYGEADGYADGELVYDMWSCPICGKRFEEWEEKPDWNFCPNCGADMRAQPPKEGSV